MKKLAKLWKIDNDEIVDINYLEDKKQANAEVEIPSYCKNFNEFEFFGEDLGKYIDNL